MIAIIPESKFCERRTYTKVSEKKSQGERFIKFVAPNGYYSGLYFNQALVYNVRPHKIIGNPYVFRICCE